MKKPNQPILLVIIMLTGLVITSCYQEKRNFNADIGFRTIVLQVNTADIGPPNNKIDQYCSFASQPTGVSDSLFTTDVAEGDKILWVGVSTSAPFDDIVTIERIIHHGGKNILKNVIQGQNGMVVGTIDKNLSDGDEEKYTIHFKVKRKGGAPAKPYHIDPKLRILH
jgi:hypothetical protein